MQQANNRIKKRLSVVSDHQSDHTYKTGFFLGGGWAKIQERSVYFFYFLKKQNGISSRGLAYQERMCWSHKAEGRDHVPSRVSFSHPMGWCSRNYGWLLALRYRQRMCFFPFIFFLGVEGCCHGPVG